MRTFDSVASLQAAVGAELDGCPWLEIDQERIKRFADATDDHQWIHVDEQRAAAGPYGRTIAHGYLTLSLIPALVRQLITLVGLESAINYGSDAVRFLSPVPVGSRIRARAALVDVQDRGGSARVVLKTTIDIEGSERPALVATTIAVYTFAH